MIKPTEINIVIKFTDHKGQRHEYHYNDHSLDSAETMIMLMTGNVSEADLEP